MVESNPSALPRFPARDKSATSAEVEAVTVDNPSPNRPIKTISTNQFRLKLKQP